MIRGRSFLQISLMNPALKKEERVLSLGKAHRGGKASMNQPNYRRSMDELETSRPQIGHTKAPGIN